MAFLRLGGGCCLGERATQNFRLIRLKVGKLFRKASGRKVPSLQDFAESQLDTVFSSSGPPPLLILTLHRPFPSLLCEFMPPFPFVVPTHRFPTPLFAVSFSPRFIRGYRQLESIPLIRRWSAGLFSSGANLVRVVSAWERSEVIWSLMSRIIKA